MTKFNYLFGPVPSRRLGISLGVDLVPLKTCSLNCIYCECGGTTHLTVKRDEYVQTAAVIDELDQFLKLNPRADYITFSGSGEPTLHTGIGRIVAFLKEKYPQYKIALLTNATLFYQAELREEVSTVDVILPSLDAASTRVFQKINRPHPALKINVIITGLVQLRRVFTGQLWLEILFVRGVNDHDAEISLLRQAIAQIKPDKVQLNTLDRPGTEKWVTPLTYDELAVIGQRLNWKTEIIVSFQKNVTPRNENIDIENSIIATIKRRPCTIEDLSSTLGSSQEEITHYLKALIHQRKIDSEVMDRGIFYKLKSDE